MISVDGTAVIRQTAGGLPLGVEKDADYPTTRVVLGPGETIMLCTDGLIETGGHDMATGWTRLRPVLEKHAEDLEELADALVQAVHGPGSHYTTGSAGGPPRGRHRGPGAAPRGAPDAQGARRGARR